MAEDIVGSNMPDFPAAELKPSSQGYGQNGFSGASSDQPGQKTTSGFLPAVGAPINSQTRTLPGSGKEKAAPDAFGMDQARARQPNASKAGV